jgi:hypothetical protein
MPLVTIRHPVQQVCCHTCWRADTCVQPDVVQLPCLPAQVPAHVVELIGRVVATHAQLLPDAAQQLVHEPGHHALL